MKKILVLYYSRTGITKKLATFIGDVLDADIEEIVDTKNRSGVMWYIMAGRDAALKRQTKIQNIIHDTSTYDVVCMWTPVRDFTMAAAMRTYLTTHEKNLPTSLVFFCTQASSWAENTFQEMANIVGKSPLMTIVCSSKEVARDSYQEQVKKQLEIAWLLVF